jgi:Tfp pilus assembly protein PilX
VSEPWGQQPQQPSGDWSAPQGGGESGSFGPPPVDPRYGAAPQYPAQQPQPQYGAQQQPQYGAPPQFGATGQQPYAEQQPYGDQSQFGGQPPQYGAQPGYGAPGVPPGYSGYVPPEYQKNGFAIAGFVLCFLPLLGIIFSVLGLVKSGKVGGKGRGLAIAGLVLSVLFIGGYAAIGLAVNKVANSPAADPACTTAEGYFNSVDSKLTADSSKLTSDSGNSAALQADLSAYTADLRNIKNSLDSALAKAQHQSVKDKIQAADTDVATVLAGIQAAQNGDMSKLAAAEDAANRLGTDGSAIDNICGTL